MTAAAFTGENLAWHVQWGVKRFDEDATAWLAARMKRSLSWRHFLQRRQPVLADFIAAGIDPYSETTLEKNLLTTAGLNRVTALIIGAAGQAASNTAYRIGVGNGTGTAAVGDTDLSAAAGSTNRWFHISDASFPTQSNGTMTFQATFGSADGNFAWNEFGIDIGTPTVTSAATVNAVLLNHKTSIAQGTKTSGQSWVASATITLS